MADFISITLRHRLLAPVILWAGLAGGLGAADDTGTAGEYRLLELEGTVQVMRSGANVWDKAYTNQVLYPGDQLQTEMRSRAVVRWSDLTLHRVGERSLIQIPQQEKSGAVIEFFRGILYYFHRDKPGEFDIRTPRVSAVVRGTDFVLQVDEDGTTRLTLIDGEVEMTNAFGALVLNSGEQAIVEPDQAPRKTAVIASVNQLQWSLYYPGILNPAELSLDTAPIQESVDAYHAGDLLRAMEAYPAERKPASEAETIYLAAILLSVGSVDDALTLLEGLPETEDENTRLAAALKHLIAAVKRQSSTPATAPTMATEWMAESYYRQANTDLSGALEAAREAAAVAPGFSFALARVAELEFSHGRIAIAREQAARSLELAPRNAQALALHGFLLAADNRIPSALDYFNRAIAVDGALGNAWLGRGLCKMRQGDRSGGLGDIQVAATLEPQRALLRSYLAKSYSAAGDNEHALHEIALAQAMDDADPTSWLYGALIKQQENRINEAVSDLEASQARNDNRSVYRSQLLLDEDRAVRGVNLANVYADAGMNEVSVREAARSVNASYANHSGHLFLANSYSRLIDPGRVNIRFETAAVSEYLLATLLSPVGAGTLSPTVSQQEYSRLFERDGMGVVSSTEYLSRGAWRQDAAWFANYGGTSVSLDVSYQQDNGQRINHEQEQTAYSVRLKQRVSDKGHVFGQVLWTDFEGGDLAQYYNPSLPVALGGPNPFVEVEERQEPIVLGGYHHQWSPGNHTLFLASRLDDQLSVTDPIQEIILIDKSEGPVIGAAAASIDQEYKSELEIYSAEAQQILERGPHTIIAGGRYQFGEFESFNKHTVTAGTGQFPSFFDDLTGDFDSDFHSSSLYGYYQVQVADPLKLVAGVSYDHVKYPENFRYAPLADDEDSEAQLSPKAGLIWTPTKRDTLRASYSRNLGGVSFDQSFSLEPSQVAGINQAYRSVVPDNVVGANAVESYDVYGISYDRKFPTRTYVGLSADWLVSDVDRDVGVYDVTDPGEFVFPLPPFIFPSTTGQALDYEEQSVSLTVNQLLGDVWAVGGSYRFSHADLTVTFKDIPAGVAPSGFSRKSDLEAYLHHVRLFGVFNHPSGFYARGEGWWFQQSNQGYSPDIPGDDFWQFNTWAGYRFFRRKADVSVGVLNLFDQDYRLNPLSLTGGLPRDRTFAARLRWNF